MADYHSSLPVGTKVGEYEIVSVLGQGGFGITYLVRDEGLHTQFALKEYFPEGLAHREGTDVRMVSGGRSAEDYAWGLRKFYDEARLLAQLSHPNIVGVRRVFEAHGSAYMVLDFVAGTTFEDWLRARAAPPSQEELDRLVVPLLDALELVHQNRSWHLDISPENIMIRNADGAPVLLDFGASRYEIKQHSQLVSALVFKSGYSAPEQYTSNADRYGPWTDIYATGATLYRAITGSRPIEATSRQLADDLKPAAEMAGDGYRQSFLRGIDTAMRLRPQQRPQSIAEWRQALEPGAAPRSSAVPGFSSISSNAAAGLLAKGRARLGAVVARVRPMVDAAIAAVQGMDRRQRIGMFAGASLAVAALAVAIAYVGSGSGSRSSEQSGRNTPTPGPQLTPRNTGPGRFAGLDVTLGSQSSNPQKGWLGVEIADVELALARSLGLLDTKGALIVNVTAGGPADTAGLRVGDIVVALGGEKIANSSDLRQRVANRSPGSRLTAETWRITTPETSFQSALQRMADDGNAYAMYRLGWNFARGSGVPRDANEAARWYGRSADAGNPSGMVALAEAMLEGTGTAKDATGALRWLRTASNAGHAEAMHRLGVLLLEGNVQRDTVEGAALIRGAAERGHPAAMFKYGQALDENDPKSAATWYERAAAAGDSGAMVNLGLLYEQGRGLPQDYVAAKQWYERAAALENPTAYSNLAGLLDNGWGVDRPYPEEAADYMIKALQLGDENALREMTTNSRAWQREFRLALQRRLSSMGLYNGPLDGEFGRSSIAAIRAAANSSR